MRVPELVDGEDREIAVGMGLPVVLLHAFERGVETRLGSGTPGHRREDRVVNS